MGLQEFQNQEEGKPIGGDVGPLPINWIKIQLHLNHVQGRGGMPEN